MLRPDFLPGQRRHFRGVARMLMAVYSAAGRLPVARTVLARTGPLLLAVATKPVDGRLAQDPRGEVLTGRPRDGVRRGTVA